MVMNALSSTSKLTGSSAWVRAPPVTPATGFRTPGTPTLLWWDASECRSASPLSPAALPPAGGSPGAALESRAPSGSSQVAPGEELAVGLLEQQVGGQAHQPDHD